MINTHEFPLVIFTVLSQSAIGAFIWCSIALCCAKLATDARARLNKAMFAIWVLMGLALALSTMHLGMPFRAMNALIRTGQAPLSNEIIGASAFAGLGFICWLVNLRKPEGSGLGKLLGLLTIVAGVFFLWAMSNVYRIPTVPVWDTYWTLVAFAGTTLIGGSILASVLFAAAKIHNNNVPCCLVRGGPLLIAGVGMVLGLTAAMAQITDMSILQHAPLRDLPELIKACVCLSSIRLILLLVGVALWACQMRRKDTPPSAALLFIAFLIVIAAEMCGRLVFYSMNMTVGMI